MMGQFEIEMASLVTTLYLSMVTTSTAGLCE